MIPGRIFVTDDTKSLFLGQTWVLSKTAGILSNNNTHYIIWRKSHYNNLAIGYRVRWNHESGIQNPPKKCPIFGIYLTIFYYFLCRMTPTFDDLSASSIDLPLLHSHEQSAGCASGVESLTSVPCGMVFCFMLEFLLTGIFSAATNFFGFFWNEGKRRFCPKTPFQVWKSLNEFHNKLQK